MKLFSLHLVIALAFCLTACGATPHARGRRPFWPLDTDDASTQRIQKTASTTSQPKKTQQKSKSSAQKPKQAAESPLVAQRRKNLAQERTKPTQKRIRPQIFPSDTDSDLAQDRRTLIKRNLDRLENQKAWNGQKASDRALIQGVFANLALDAQPENRSIEELKNLGRARQGTPKLGDLIFFEAGGQAPQVGVFRRAQGQTYEVLAVTRGAARIVYVDLTHPHERRVNGRIVNSFLRAPKRQDSSKTAYLAGGLFRGARTLLD